VLRGAGEAIAAAFVAAGVDFSNGGVRLGAPAGCSVAPLSQVLASARPLYPGIDPIDAARSAAQKAASPSRAATDEEHAHQITAALMALIDRYRFELISVGDTSASFFGMRLAAAVLALRDRADHPLVRYVNDRPRGAQRTSSEREHFRDYVADAYFSLRAILPNVSDESCWVQIAAWVHEACPPSRPKDEVGYRKVREWSLDLEDRDPRRAEDWRSHGRERLAILGENAAVAEMHDAVLNWFANYRPLAPEEEGAAA
jgi:hypothetical protein